MSSLIFYRFLFLLSLSFLTWVEIWTGERSSAVRADVVVLVAASFFVFFNDDRFNYCNMDCLADARLLFDKSVLLDLVSWNTMISAYGKNGDLETAKVLFDKMPERNLVSWSALIDGYVGVGDFAEALRLFRLLRAEGILPDSVVLVSVLKACAHLGALEEGQLICRYIDQNNLAGEENLVLALMDMYCKCGRVGREALD